MTGWCVTTAWTPDHVTALATVGLLVLAVASAIIAYIQFTNWKMDAKVERTLKHIDAWWSKAGDDPSPDSCYESLNLKEFGTLSELKTMSMKDVPYRKAVTAFTILHNYFEKASTYMARGLMDPSLFFHGQQLIVRVSDAVLADYYTLFSAQRLYPATHQPLKTLMECLEQDEARVVVASINVGVFRLDITKKVRVVGKAADLGIAV